VKRRPISEQVAVRRPAQETHETHSTTDFDKNETDARRKTCVDTQQASAPATALVTGKDDPTPRLNDKFPQFCVIRRTPRFEETPMESAPASSFVQGRYYSSNRIASILKTPGEISSVGKQVPQAGASPAARRFGARREKPPITFGDSRFPL